jgi:hypothetical protein
LQLVQRGENKQESSEGKSMNNQFDELTKSVAQSVTRRAALKKFGVGLTGIALACFGLANKAEAKPPRIPKWCNLATNPCCCKNEQTWLPPDSDYYLTCQFQCRGRL